ncbi:hypothetical protein SOVF_056750 [Spinacia oleracea]|uniref:Probable inactive leucine-rich repeat receptor-like protein kinase At3g03770 n=1 Tax=Spinacia oleracea TaxID=3562 RepID=A0A9R0IEB5_SPIOL|nr:probable inactive leucine-rich repeat receptor-like protein kinase At3g03770 [Spinacia oleracea]XP_056683909.1 probable inactive leucine-rich repeat receptor-like protein kinase At3g03770 [Spinacia oleracea]KNA19949.1 hypothetical protein SOVF_056750 [Spinacia oleracea]
MGMSYWSLYLIFSITWSICIVGTSQLQSSQIQVLLQLRKHLEYPNELEVWNNDEQNICSNSKINVTCEVDVVTELRIMGGKPKPSKVGKFVGYAIPNLTLSDKFSMDSFVATLARLTSLRALSLVSLGIWGPLPDKINRLSSLEFLDLSSNFLYGSVPPRIATMVKLQTLRLDGNFFNESVPDWLDSLSNLSVLSLSDNHLKGPFPASIGKIRTLSTLALSNNKISGEVPDLSSLRGLRMLDLSWNELDSKLPNFPGALFMALLNNNSFNGEIPRGFKKLNHLQHLDLSLNHLQGRLPTILFSLPNISYLNLAANELSGSLPLHLVCGRKLEFADLSNNRLTGKVPRCLTKITSQFYGNCLNYGGINQHPESYCAKIQENTSSSSAISTLTLVCVIGGVLVVMGILAVGFLLIYRRYCPSGCQEQSLLQKQVVENSVTGVTSEILANARYISEAAKSGTQGIPACRAFSMEELKDATKNFDTSALMGEGARGKMYQGTLPNKTLVAIRCLSLSNKFTTRNLKLRLDLLAKLRHPHLVCLMGHCIETGAKADSDGNKVYLVYEYVPNGNLRSHLSDLGRVRALKWPERLVILTDIAKAVQFLHTGIIPGFFNNRLRTNNILIDEYRRAKLSDYGLSIIYDDEEFGGKGVTAKSWQMKILEDDIYCFGFILLESLIGPSVAAKKKAVLLSEMAALSSEEGQRRVVDPIVLSTSTKESLATVISITNKCVSSETSTRPSFEDVLWNLQYAAQVQATADGDQRFASPTHS